MALNARRGVAHCLEEMTFWRIYQVFVYGEEHDTRETG